MAKSYITSGNMKKAFTLLKNKINTKANSSHSHDSEYMKRYNGNYEKIYAKSIFGSDGVSSINVNGSDFFLAANNCNINIRSKALQSRNYDNTAWTAVYASNFGVSSSIRYKENIREMSDEIGKRILQYRVVEYDYKNKADGINRQGLIAEEVYEIDKFPVLLNDNGIVDSIDYSSFVPQLIKMVQIQQKEIDELKEEIRNLKG